MAGSRKSGDSGDSGGSRLDDQEEHGEGDHKEQDIIRSGKA